MRKTKTIFTLGLFIVMLFGFTSFNVAGDENARIVSCDVSGLNDDYATVWANFRGSWRDDAVTKAWKNIIGSKKLEYWYDARFYKVDPSWISGDDQIGHQLTYYREITSGGRDCSNGVDVYFSEIGKTYECVSANRAQNMVYSLKATGISLSGLEGEEIYVKVRLRAKMHGFIDMLDMLGISGGSWSTAWEKSDIKKVK